MITLGQDNLVISLKPYQGPLEFEAAMDIAQLTDGASVSANAQGNVRLNDEGKVSVRGSIKYDYSYQCDRCGMPSVMTVNYAFDELFDNNPDNEDDYYYEGDRIDLGTMLRDCVLFSIPTRRVCAESCKGLCGVCGANLNIISCGCVTQPEGTVSPFDVLKDFGGEE